METIVPVPGVNPAGPYSMFHIVSVPPAVHPKSAEAVVMLEVVSPDGGKHDGVSKIVTTMFDQSAFDPDQDWLRTTSKVPSVPGS